MDGKKHYLIRVSGKLPQVYTAWLEGFEIIENIDDSTFTRLSGNVIDQSHLRALLNKLFDLNIEIVSIQQIYDATDDGGCDE